MSKAALQEILQKFVLRLLQDATPSPNL
jgi:hypothetical protein